MISLKNLNFLQLVMLLLLSACNSSLPSGPAYEKFQNPNYKINGIWNEWIEPHVVATGNDIYFGCVGAGLSGGSGEIWICKKTGDGQIQQTLSARVRDNGTDDHNSPAILLDNRANAPYPIIVFQSEHGSHPMRFARLGSIIPDEWHFNWENLPGDNVSYAQAFRHNDEILVACRAQNPLPGFTRTTRAIVWYYSPDNGNTWQHKPVFYQNGESWPYILHKEKEDGSGINLIITAHPLKSNQKSIYCLELNWATGAIVNPANRSNPVVANFRTIFTDDNWKGINPYQKGVACKLLTMQGINTTRLWDVSRSINGNCIMLYTLVPSNHKSMATFNHSQNRALSFNLDNGIINWDIFISDAGMPNERPVGDNFYFSGMCVIDEHRIFSLVYKNQSQLDGGNNTSIDDGKTVGYMVDITKPLQPQTSVFTTSPHKLMRPYKPRNSNLLLWCDCSYYHSYTEFTSNIVVNHVN